MGNPLGEQASSSQGEIYIFVSDISVDNLRLTVVLVSAKTCRYMALLSEIKYTISTISILSTTTFWFARRQMVQIKMTLSILVAVSNQFQTKFIRCRHYYKICSAFYNVSLIMQRNWNNQKVFYNFFWYFQNLFYNLIYLF